MSTKKVNVLNSDAALALGRDAKIVAIRWDLIPWCLVLDCDIPVQEDVKNAPVCRMWMVFNGMSEISWQVDSARLPNGIFSTNVLVASESLGGFQKYELSVLAPAFSGSEMVRKNPHSKMIIRAKELIGATSVARAYFGEFGPDRLQRNALASDNDFLHTISEARNTLPSMPRVANNGTEANGGTGSE